MALQSLESNPQLSFATRMEDWTCLGQNKRHHMRHCMVDAVSAGDQHAIDDLCDAIDKLMK